MWSILSRSLQTPSKFFFTFFFFRQTLFFSPSSICISSIWKSVTDFRQWQLSNTGSNLSALLFLVTYLIWLQFFFSANTRPTKTDYETKGPCAPSFCIHFPFLLPCFPSLCSHSRCLCCHFESLWCNFACHCSCFWEISPWTLVFSDEREIWLLDDALNSSANRQKYRKS